MATTAQRERLLRATERAIRKSDDPTRHKCFVSYNADDADEVAEFIETFGEVFIPRVIGVTEEDDFIDSENIDYVMNRIREKYLQDSTVTIVMIGKCTWARRFVDWELYSSLRSPRNGLMAVTLPSVADDDSRQLPARLDDNVDGDKGYARWWKYPTGTSQLRGYIDGAFDARTSRADLADNSRSRRQRNAIC
jgi:hypothetical protein